jgi:hypothetical protein
MTTISLIYWSVGIISAIVLINIYHYYFRRNKKCKV